jgi:hypothetical protein
VEDPSFGTHCLHYYPRAAAVFGETGSSGLGSRPSGFPASGLSCPANGRCTHSDRLLRSNLHGQTPQWALTISGGSASVVDPTVSTTLPKKGKVDTSSAEAPMTRTLVARPESEVPDDNPIDNDPNLLNFTVWSPRSLVGQAPGYRSAGMTQGNWTV